MEEYDFTTVEGAEKGKKDLPIEFSNRMKYPLHVINPHVFDLFFGRSISFLYQELGDRQMGPMVYLSKAVAEKIKKDQDVNGPNRPTFSDYIHEHVVPKKLYAKEYFYESYIAIHKGGQKKIFDENYFKVFCEKICVICIITKEENTKLREKKLTSKMPDGITLDYDHPEKIKKSEVWSRYIKVDIKVVKPEWDGNRLKSYVDFDLEK